MGDRGGCGVETEEDEGENIRQSNGHDTQHRATPAWHKRAEEWESAGASNRLAIENEEVPTNSHCPPTPCDKLKHNDSHNDSHSLDQQQM